MSSPNGRRTAQPRTAKKPQEDLRAMAAELRDVVGQGKDRIQAWLASPTGAQFRKRFATAVIVSAPVVLRSKLFRVSPLGRLIAAAGGAAVLVKLAEALRDWEPPGSPA